MDRIKVITAATADRPADAVLIRPDGYVAWAADPQTPQGSGGPPARPAHLVRRPGPAARRARYSSRLASESASRRGHFARLDKADLHPHGVRAHVPEQAIVAG